MAITKVDLFQGYIQGDEDFGYVHGDNGGFFFTWKPTLEQTLESVEEDETDGDGGLDRQDVIEYLREYLPGTGRGMAKWPAKMQVLLVECRWDAPVGGTAGWYCEAFGKGDRLASDSQKIDFPVDTDEFGQDDEDDLREAIAEAFPGAKIVIS